EGEGSEKNPVQIDYPKRRGTAYPDIYIGPLSSGWIPQTVLNRLSGSPAQKREELKEKNLEGVKKSEIENWDGKIHIYKATTPKQPLPVPTPEGVGLEAQFASIAPGKILVYDESHGTGGGG